MGTGEGGDVCVCVYVWSVASDSVCSVYWLQVTYGIVHGVSVNVCVHLFLYASLSLCIYF